ncbi:adhesin [Candidatus Pantoea alvi]|nr:adhesin [Pantoea alvi]
MVALDKYGTIQYVVNDEVNYTDALMASWVSAATSNTGLLGTVGWNAAGGATSNYIKGDDPLKGGAISGAASGLGYGAGKFFQGQLDKVLNPNWKNWEWVDVGMGISKPHPVNPVPGMAGNASGSATTEILNDQLGKAAVNSNAGKQ